MEIKNDHAFKAKLSRIKHWSSHLSLKTWWEWLAHPTPHYDRAISEQLVYPSVHHSFSAFQYANWLCGPLVSHDWVLMCLWTGCALALHSHAVELCDLNVKGNGRRRQWQTDRRLEAEMNDGEGEREMERSSISLIWRLCNITDLNDRERHRTALISDPPSTVNNRHLHSNQFDVGTGKEEPGKLTNLIPWNRWAPHEGRVG